MRRLVPCLLLALGLVALAPTPSARAQEVKEIALAQQFGAIFIPLMAMENMGLIEKQAAARGLGELKVTWAKMAGPSVMVDAIISGDDKAARQIAADQIHASQHMVLDALLASPSLLSTNVVVFPAAPPAPGRTRPRR